MLRAAEQVAGIALQGRFRCLWRCACADNKNYPLFLKPLLRFLRYIVRPRRPLILQAVKYLVLLHCMAFYSPSFAGDATTEGQRLAMQVYERPDGDNISIHAVMKLKEKGHSPRVRDMFMYERDNKPGQVWSLIRFTSPASIDGTGLLTLNEPGDESSQWVYLPALDRVRRIVSSRKGGRFVGSDFYYEDLRDREVSMDHHRLLGAETIGDVDCKILESIPVDGDNSVYTKRISWIDPQTLIAIRVDFYTGESEPRKRLMVHRIEEIQGYDTVVDSTMTDLASGHHTRITARAVVYDRDLPDTLFTRRVLSDPVFEARYRP